MNFKVGDKVVHRLYGPGEITELARRVIAGNSTLCYVVKVGELIVYVPSDAIPSSLRGPTPAEDFESLFEILRHPGSQLAHDRFERRLSLVEQMKVGTLQATCHVIRDLYDYKLSNKINDQDTAVFERALRFLLDEWTIVLGVPSSQAEHEISLLLGEAPHSIFNRLHRNY
jgi:RNA polymerase-interacting CarD/CdnL/TRCF family regulator